MGGQSYREAGITGVSAGPAQAWFLAGLRRVMESRDYVFRQDSPELSQFILNVIEATVPRPFHRRSVSTYVVAIAETDAEPGNVLKVAYPLLVRAVANLVIYLVAARPYPRAYFITPEQGCYEIPRACSENEFFQNAFADLVPLAESTLIIENERVDDLPRWLCLEDPIPEQIRLAGSRLDRMGLLPSPFPVEELLSPGDLRRVRLLFGLGGLSYGNLSARSACAPGFWMSATGVDKGRLGDAGRDILFIKGYNLERRAILVRTLPDVPPRHASVDAIEHAMIYQEHCGIGAIVHVHSWLNDVPATQINYPCGTIELALAVSAVLRRLPDPTRGIVGLKNHGLTITGPSLDDIFDRIDGKLLPTVPSVPMEPRPALNGE